MRSDRQNQTVKIFILYLQVMDPTYLLYLMFFVYMYMYVLDINLPE